MTAAIESLVSLGFNEIPNLDKVRNSDNPLVLMTSTILNQHILGLRLIEHWLCEQGIPNRVVVPGLRENEILQLVQTLKPAIVGLSFSLPSPEINPILTRLVEQKSGAQIIVGGRYIRTCDISDLPAGVTICNSILELSNLLAKTKVKLNE